MQNIFTCLKFGSSLECYVGTGYGNPYKHLQGCFGFDLCTVLYEGGERECTKMPNLLQHSCPVLSQNKTQCMIG